MCIIFIVLTLLLVIPVIEVSEANPYDLYNIDTYNCLDIAIDCQRWHEGNGINTTIVIGMFNETHDHTWRIDTDTVRI